MQYRQNDEYFDRINRETQVAHLKGLIASRICELNGELFLPSTDGSQIAVLGRKTYRGQLAFILSELPGKKTRLVGANIYTARSHGFILDVFEFETDQTPVVDATFSEEIVEKMASQTGSDQEVIRDFLGRIRTTSVKSPNLEKLTRFFNAYQKVSVSHPAAVDQAADHDGLCDIVVAIHSQEERQTFRSTAESLSGRSLDIEQAELVVVRFDKAANEPKNTRTDKVVLMNFLVSGTGAESLNVNEWESSLTADFGAP